MITDLVENARCYGGLGAEIEKALRLIATLDASAACGRHEADGEDLYYIVSEPETSAPERAAFESHEAYLDLHVTLSGCEWMEYAPVPSLTRTQDHLKELDYALYGGGGSLVKVPRGSFYLVFPQDAHKPNLFLKTREPLKKAVVKIRIKSCGRAGL